MILITELGNIDLSELFLITVKQYGIPTKSSQNYHVIDRDGEFTFTNGFMNRVYTINMVDKEYINLAERRTKFSTITPYLLCNGEVVFEFESHIKYRYQLLKGTTVNFSTTYDTITFQLELSPYGFSSIDEENITWEQAKIIWMAAGFSWQGSQNSFVVSNEIFEVENLGNVEALPIIKVTGTGNITLLLNGVSLVITGLNGTINVDCENFIVYDDSNVNKFSLTNGKFPILNPGINNCNITGSATIEFINKSRWI